MRHIQKIKKNDNVEILLGKDRGKSGKVLKVVPKDNQVLVEGINMYKRHVRKMADREGTIVDITKPVNISNVAIICSKCNRASRVGFKIEGDQKLRICRRCKTEIKN